MKRWLPSALVGLALAAALLGLLARWQPRLQASPPHDPGSLALANVWAKDLTFVVQTETGEKITLGTVHPGQQRVFQDVLLSISGQQLDIHAKDPEGWVFYSIFIDRDELAQRKGYLQFPGSNGGRREKAMQPPWITPLPLPTLRPTPTP